VLHVGLDDGVGKATADETLGIEDGVCGIDVGLVLGGSSNQSLGVSEGDVGRGGSVTLFVSNDFNSVVLPDTYARVGGS